MRIMLICCGAILSVHAASAQSPWYVSGSAGAFLRSDASGSITIFNGSGLTGPGTNTTTYDPGPILNLAVGYKLPFGFRIEGEAGYRHYSVSSISPVSTDGTFPNLVGNRLSLQSGGATDGFTATVNGFYDFPIGGQFVPYVGVGIGLAHDDVATAVFAGPRVSKFTRSGRTTTSATILAEVGVTIAVTPQWAVVPSYRYEHDFSSLPLNANILKIGLRYSF